MSLSVNLRRVGDVPVMSFKGDVDIATAPVLRDSISQVMAKGVNRIVVDLSDVGFLDSTGLGVLVGRLKAVRGTDGAMSVVITNPHVLRNFHITGLDRIFTIHPDADEAAAALAA